MIKKEIWKIFYSPNFALRHVYAFVLGLCVYTSVCVCKRKSKNNIKNAIE